MWTFTDIFPDMTAIASSVTALNEQETLNAEPLWTFFIPKTIRNIIYVFSVNFTVAKRYLKVCQTSIIQPSPHFVSKMSNHLSIVINDCYIALIIWKHHRGVKISICHRTTMFETSPVILRSNTVVLSCIWFYFSDIIFNYLGIFASVYIFSFIHKVSISKKKKKKIIPQK